MVVSFSRYLNHVLCVRIAYSTERKVRRVETQAGCLLVLTDCGQVLTWSAGGRGSSDRSWNAAFRETWPNRLTAVQLPGPAIDGITTDGVHLLAWGHRGSSGPTAGTTFFLL